MAEKIFISGPMTGYEDFNFPRFDEVERLMKENGYDVINPANVCRKYRREKVLADNNIFDQMIVEEQEEERTCTAILLLEGWENSVGCRREIRTALDLNFNFYQEKHFPFLTSVKGDS